MAHLTPDERRAEVAVALSKENLELRRQIRAWRKCVIVDVKMGGAKFQGFSNSEGQRVFDEFWVPPRGSRGPRVSEEGTEE